MAIHNVLLSVPKCQVSQMAREGRVLIWMRPLGETPNYSKMLISIFQNSKVFTKYYHV